MSKQNLSAFSVLVALLLATKATATCLNTFQNCGAGCYNKDNLVLNGGLRICSPVGAGYSSPRNDNDRYQCRRGSYSSHDEAEFCSICDAGSISDTGFRECFLCPSGFYQELPGQATCKECVPGYDGDGANNFSYNAMTNTLHCELTGVEPSMAPSVPPSKSPSLRASATPSRAPSRQPSRVPSADPSSKPSRKPSLGPSSSPSRNPSATPSRKPSRHPSSSPSRNPSATPTRAPSAVPSMAPSLRRRRATVPASVFVVTVSLVLVLLAAFVCKICVQRRKMHAKEHAELHETAAAMSGDDLDDAAFVQSILQQHQPAKVDEKDSKAKAMGMIVILDAVAVEVTADESIV